MTAYTGRNTYIKFGATVLSLDYRTFEETHENATVEASAGADARRSYLSTLIDGRLSLEYVDQAGGTVIWAALAPGTSGTLEWGPEGTATGKPKNSVEALVMSRNRTFAYDDVATVAVEFQLSGDVTEALY